MKHVIKFFTCLSMVLFIASSMNAQTATTVANTSDAQKSEIKNCDPALCDAMVKAGLCTKEEAAKCKAKCVAGEKVSCTAKTTKVAAASVERVDAVPVKSEATNKKASCVKACAKTCASKKKAKAE